MFDPRRTSTGKSVSVTFSATSESETLILTIFAYPSARPPSATANKGHIAAANAATNHLLTFPFMFIPFRNYLTITVKPGFLPSVFVNTIIAQQASGPHLRLSQIRLNTSQGEIGGNHGVCRATIAAPTIGASSICGRIS